MQLRTLVLIAIAMACGIAASIGVASLMGDTAASPEPEPTTKIYVALRDLSNGELLNERNVRLVQWPTRGLPPGAIEQIDQLKSRQVSGRISSGQPIQQIQIKGPSAVELVAEPAPEPRLVALELPHDSTGPWIVSKGEQPLVAPLGDLWRQAVELAKRSEPEPSRPVPVDSTTVAERNVETEPDSPGPSATTETRPHVSQPAPATGNASTDTTEGAKVIRWRNSGTSMTAEILGPRRPTRAPAAVRRIEANSNELDQPVAPTVREARLTDAKVSP